MKVVTRRENEGLVIGDDIHVTVLEVRLNHVRLAISSPCHVPSYWEETLVWEEPDEAPSGLQLASARF